MATVSSVLPPSHMTTSSNSLTDSKQAIKEEAELNVNMQLNKDFIHVFIKTKNDDTDSNGMNSF